MTDAGGSSPRRAGGSFGRATAVAVALAGVVAALASIALRGGGSAPRCDLVVAPSGSDAARGTLRAPFRRVARMAAALSPGQIGCLRRGVYREDVKLVAGGRAGAEITIRSFPGERATLAGRLWLARGADRLVVAELDLNGAPAGGVNRDRLPSPTVDAAHDTFVGDDVTNDHSAICFLLGSTQFGRASATAIVRNRIHDCGRLPPRNYDHGIYVERAEATKITGNWIYANADRGVQLFPNAQRTTIEHNVIDGNGEGIIFSGEGRVSSSDTTVAGNLITNSAVRGNVEDFYPRGTPPGHGNRVAHNCIHGGVADHGDGGIDNSAGGFEADHNRLVDPAYVDPTRGDYRLRDGSPCADLAVGPPP